MARPRRAAIVKPPFVAGESEMGRCSMRSRHAAGRMKIHAFEAKNKVFPAGWSGRKIMPARTPRVGAGIRRVRAMMEKRFCMGKS